MNKEVKNYKIILVRHGESEGNVDPTKYMTIPDHKIQLTNNGKNQSIQVGKNIKKIIKDEPLDVFVSPYKRTIQTWEGIRSGLNRNNLTITYDSRIREQEHKIFKNQNERKEAFQDQKEFSKFFWRFGGGESGADVDARVISFLQGLQMHRRIFEHEHDCLFVAHEIALRAIICRLYSLMPDDFDNMPMIENCSPIVLNTSDFISAQIDENLTTGNKELIDFFKGK